MADLLVPTNVIADLRRKIGERENIEPWTDEVLTQVLQAFALPDAEGNAPGSDNWVPTYDTNAAAASVWDEKAAMFASEIDATVDGTTVRRSQRFRHARQMAAYYRAQRGARVVAMTSFGDVANVTLDEVSDGASE